MKKNLNKPFVGRIYLISLLLIFIIPFALVVYQLLSEMDAKIEFFQKERLGIQYNQPLRRLLEEFIEYRRLVDTYLNGNSALQPQIVAQQSRIEETIKLINAVDYQLGSTLKTTQQWMAFKRQWQALKGNALSLNSQNNFDNNTALITDIISLIRHVGDTSNLITDPILDSYYLMDAVVTKLPPAIEETARARDLNAQIVADRRMTEAEKAQLTILSSLIKSPTDAVNRGLQVAFGFNPALKPKLESNSQDNVTAINEFLSLTNKQIISDQSITIQPADYFASGTKAIQAQFRLYDVVSPALDGLLQKRIDEFARRKYRVLAFSLLVLATIIYVLVAFSRS